MLWRPSPLMSLRPRGGAGALPLGKREAQIFAHQSALQNTYGEKAGGEEEDRAGNLHGRERRRGEYIVGDFLGWEEVSLSDFRGGSGVVVIASSSDRSRQIRAINRKERKEVPQRSQRKTGSAFSEDCPRTGFQVLSQGAGTFTQAIPADFAA